MTFIFIYTIMLIPAAIAGIVWMEYSQWIDYPSMHNWLHKIDRKITLERI